MPREPTSMLKLLNMGSLIRLAVPGMPDQTTLSQSFGIRLLGPLHSSLGSISVCANGFPSSFVPTKCGESGSNGKVDKTEA
jgi:hypothetical protein